MRLFPVFLLSCVVLAACSSPTRPAALCAVMVKINGTVYHRAGPATAADLGEQLATVERSRDCEDVFVTASGQPTTTATEINDGEAIGLPAGTPLHHFIGSLESDGLIANIAGEGLVEFRSYPIPD